MGVKIVLTLIIVFILGFLSVLYFLPISSLEFRQKNINHNFSLEGEINSMQFYPNMRFKSNEITYNISGCELQKRQDMLRAFEFLENLTSLTFKAGDLNSDILVSCEDKIRYSGELFIAGEGGPTNITISGLFNVITRGEVLLLRKTFCPTPNIAIHELLHALGFKHSSNPGNIMYNITKCEQDMDEDMIKYIDRLYTLPSLPDLILYNTSAKLEGRFLDLETSILNEGLEDAGNSTLIISSQDEVLKEVPLSEIKMGSGRAISLTHVWVSKLEVKEIEVTIESNIEELNKQNNKIKLELIE